MHSIQAVAVQQRTLPRLPNLKHNFQFGKEKEKPKKTVQGPDVIKERLLKVI